MIDQVLLHGVGEVAEGRRLAVNGVGQVPAEALVQRGDEFDALQRIEAERVDRCFGRDVGEPVPDNASACWQTAASAADCAGARGAAAGAADAAGTAVAVPGEGLELAGQECGAAGVALDLAAGGLGDRAAADQHDGVERQAVLVEHRGTDRIQDRRQIGTPIAHDLVHEDEALRAVFVDGERGAEAGFQQRVACARRGFDVLRVMVEAADDDEVVDPAGDVELPLVHEAQVAGAQEGAVAGVAQARVKRRRGLFGIAPVALADGLAGDPDLADAVGRRAARRSRARRSPRAASRRARRSRPGGGRRAHRRAPARRVSARGHRRGRRAPWRRFPPRAGDHERRLRQAVAGIEGRGPESARREGLGEAFERCRLDGLGADERDGPGGEVEGGALLRRDLANAQVVGEVGSAGDGRAVPADRIEPEEGILEERRGRHDDVRNAAVDRREDAADEPHVVVGGQPEDAFVSRPRSKALLMARVLATRLAWLSMTPLGWLVEPEVYWIIASESGAGSCSIQPSAWASVSSSVAIQRTAAARPVDRLHIGDGGGGAEHERRSGVADERVEAIERACPRRVDGHGDAAGVEAPKKAAMNSRPGG